MGGPNSLVATKPSTSTLKFLCSYGGKILPRYPDGKLRYLGGETRVLAVDSSIPFSELQKKLSDLCGVPTTVRCQLPTEDLDALVSITCDEDLANLVEEYARAASPKIRAFLSPPKPNIKKVLSPPTSSASSSLSPRSPPAGHRCFRQIPTPSQLHTAPPPKPASGKMPFCACHHHGNGHGSHGHIYLVHNGNHWQ